MAFFGGLLYGLDHSGHLGGEVALLESYPKSINVLERMSQENN
jgi:hypothetical protein